MTHVVVIGGGIAGLSAATELAKNAEVTLLEAETSLGYHTSGRSAALIEKNYGSASVKALNRITFDVLKDGGYLSPRGLMLLAKDQDQEAFQQDLTTMNLEQLSVADARAMVPILDPGAVAFAGYHADAWDIDTDRLLQDHARRLRALGGTVRTGARVDGLSHSNGRWSVQIGSEQLTADLVVNAAGAWADQLATMAGIATLSITPMRRSVARVPAPEAHDVSDWPIFFGVSESWYAKPDAGALLISPADEEPTDPHDAWAEELTLATGIAKYQEMVTHEVTRLLSNWAGLRSFAPDRTLVLGPDPSAPQFVWCAGQGGYGFQTSSAAAQLLADLVFARKPQLSDEVVALLRPDRLR